MSKSSLSIILLICLTVFLGSCAGTKVKEKKNWVEEAEEEFMNDCRSKVKRNPEFDRDKYCSCLLLQLKTKYTPVEASRLTSKEVKNLGKECREKYAKN